MEPVGMDGHLYEQRLPTPCCNGGGGGGKGRMWLSSSRVIRPAMECYAAVKNHLSEV